MEPDPLFPRCPDCETPPPDGAPSCPACGLHLVGPVATELRTVLAELAEVERRHAALMARRRDLLESLRAHSRQAAEPAVAAAAPAGPPPPPSAPAPAGAVAHAPAPRERATERERNAPSPLTTAGAWLRRELSAHSARNVLLGLGALLLAIAALVFTVVTWSRLGVPGKTVILGGVTVVLGYLPKPLLDRGMRATAETLGSLVAVLLCLDALSLGLLFASANAGRGLFYAAAALALIALALVGYTRVLPLRAPRVIALLLAQPIPHLTALGAIWFGQEDVGFQLLAGAFLVTAIGDAALHKHGGTRSPRSTARVLFAVSWSAGSALIAALTIGALTGILDPAGAGRIPAGLGLAGTIALYSAVGSPRGWARTALTAAVTLLWSAIPAVILGMLTPAVWAWPAWGLSGVAIAGLLHRIPREWRAGPQAATALVCATMTVRAIPALTALGEQTRWLARPWSGAGEPSSAVLHDTLTLAAACLGWAAWLATVRPEWRFRCATVAGALGAVIVAGHSPYPGAVATLTAATVALLALAVSAGRGNIETAGNTLAVIALGLAGGTAVLALAVGLATPAATLTVLTTLTPACVGAALPRTAPSVHVAGTVAGVAGATALVGTAYSLLSASPPVMALAQLAVAAIAVAAGTVLAQWHGRSRQLHTLEAATALPTLTALGFAVPGGRELVALTAALAAFVILAAAARDTFLRHRRPTVTLWAGTALALGAVAVLIDRVGATVAGPQLLAARPWQAGVPATLPLFDTAQGNGGLPLALSLAGTALALRVGIRVNRDTAVTAGTVTAAALVVVLLAHLGVPYDLALVALGGSTAVLFFRSGHHRGGNAHVVLWTGVGVAVMACGWSLATPERTIMMLGALSVAATYGAARATPMTRTSAPFASAALACVAALGAGGSVLACYAALPQVGLDASPRGLPFVGIAMAGAVAAVSRLLNLENRPEQRRGLLIAGLLLVLVGSRLSADAPGTLGMSAALAALVLMALTGLTAGLTGRLIAGAAGIATLLAFGTVGADLVNALTAPYSRLGAVWHGVGPHGPGTPAQEALLGTGSSLSPLLVPTTTGGAMGVLLVVRYHAPRYVAHASALLATPVLAPYALALDLPYALALAWFLGLAGCLLGLATRARRPGVADVTAAAALWPASLAAAWGLAEWSATLLTIGLLAVLAASAAALATSARLIVGATAATVLLCGAFAVAVLRAAGQPVEVAALGLVAIIAGVSGTLAGIRVNSRTARAAEAATVPLAIVAVGMTLANTERLELTSVTLAALGVIALASAQRDRRRWPAAIGAALILAALWVLLGWLRVIAPEPYLAVPAVAALATGWEWRRRALRDRATDPARATPGSWTAYGPGLALALLPSLAMVLLTEDDPVRSALLGAAALTVTVLGGRFRLRAPLLTGGAVLLLLATSAFGAPMWESALTVPRWIPVGAAGLLLLGVGASYERRLRDLRRLRESWRRFE